MEQVTHRLELLPPIQFLIINKSTTAIGFGPLLPRPSFLPFFSITYLWATTSHYSLQNSLPRALNLPCLTLFFDVRALFHSFSKPLHSLLVILESATQTVSPRILSLIPPFLYFQPRLRPLLCTRHSVPLLVSDLHGLDPALGQKPCYQWGDSDLIV